LFYCKYLFFYEVSARSKVKKLTDDTNKEMFQKSKRENTKRQKNVVTLKNAGKWAQQMKEYVKSKGRDLKKLYFFYTTCPKCAEHYGKNYVVMVAQV
jgi:hypothetical protein